MPKIKKTDNQTLVEKLELRKRICTELQEPLRVLDLFCGEQAIWTALRRHFQVDLYTPVDHLEKPGAIKMKVTPRTVQGFDPSVFNVIDFDCYGDPWEIWAAVAPRIRQRTAVFLTFGHLGLGGDSCSYFLREQNGIPSDWPIPVNREINIFLGRRYFQRSMYEAGAQLALVRDHERVSYYGALLLGASSLIGSKTG